MKVTVRKKERKKKKERNENYRDKWIKNIK